MFVHDMDLDVPVTDNRRLKVVVDGLPLHGGAQLAVDTTLVCALHADGTPRRGAAASDGVALKAAWRRKEATYPELVGPHSRAKLVVVAMEVGGAVVKRDALFPESVGSCTRETRSPFALTPRRASMANEMGCHAGMHCG